MSELGILVMTVVCLGFCLWPFFRSRATVVAASAGDTPLGRLAQRKETILQNIADLDFEYRMGKLGEDDYHELRGTLKQQAAEVLDQMDVVQATEALLGGAKPTAKSAAPARFCTACGAALPSEARFCASCGAPVEQS
jgi:hypothetical protein